MSWHKHTDHLSRRWEFKNFSDAFAFATKCALLFEKCDHHPDLTVGYGYVEIKTTTHDASNQVTDRDWAITKVIDRLGLE